MAATMAYALLAVLATAPQAQVLVVGGSPGAAGPTAQAMRALSQAELVQLARANVVTQLPVGARLVRIDADEGLRVPKGKLRVDVELPSQLEGGVQPVIATLHVGSWQQQVLVRMSLAMLTAHGQVAPLIKRGSEVLVIVRTGNVLVQSMGTAQENGGLEQPISVIPNASGRVVRGRVKDARTVEVAL